MRFAMLLAVSIVTVGFATSEPSDAQLGALDTFSRGALASQKTGVCSVHHVRMHREHVPVEYGHLPIAFWSSWYHYAELTEFPNAREYALTLDPRREARHEKAWRYVCDRCKDAERKWMLKHPNDEFAKTLGPKKV
jgi:hypothetical protein